MKSGWAVSWCLGAGLAWLVGCSLKAAEPDPGGVVLGLHFEPTSPETSQVVADVLVSRMKNMGMLHGKAVAISRSEVSVYVPATLPRSTWAQLLSKQVLAFYRVDETLSRDDIHRCLQVHNAAPAETDGLPPCLLPPGRIILPLVSSSGEGLAVVTPPALSRDAIERAKLSLANEAMIPEVKVSLTAKGAKKFCALTREVAGGQLAIIVDGEVLSAPVVNEPICGGEVVIAMGGSGNAMLEGRVLESALNTAPLPVELTIQDERAVGPGEFVGRD